MEKRRARRGDIPSKPTKNFRQQFADVLMRQMGLDVPPPSNKVMKRMRAGDASRGQPPSCTGIAGRHFGIYGNGDAHLAFG